MGKEREGKRGRERREGMEGRNWRGRWDIFCKQIAALLIICPIAIP